jgi:hypothetical protein
VPAIGAAAARITRREVALVAGLLLVAAAVRLVLAARGWPELNSDEAVLGLMARDIQAGRAHPIFFYGQQYMGASQAYLVAGAFTALGPTRFALHATATLQVVAALLLLYLFSRLVYSRAVAAITLALLALGPYHALFDTLRTGAGIQDTIFFGALLLALTALRLRHPVRRWKRLALDAGIGLAIGLGLWCDFLIAPFVLVVLVALGGDFFARQQGKRGRRVAITFAVRALPIAGMACLGMLPLIVANIASHGATFTQVRGIAGGPSNDVTGPGAPLVHLAQQVASTLIIALPQLMGTATLCPHCQLWPDPQRALPPAEMLRTAVVALPFSAIVIALWLGEARPITRVVMPVVRSWLPQRGQAGVLASTSGIRAGAYLTTDQRAGRPTSPLKHAGDDLPPWRRSPDQAARWWGQVMVLLAAALTVLAYVFSRASYLYLAGSVRYLNGLVLCTPLIVAPLWRVVEPTWRSFTAPRQITRGTQPRSRPLVILSLLLLATLFALNAKGAGDALAKSNDRATYGVPAGGRDAHLLDFLQAHGVTDFYAGYWTCYRLLFESSEHAICAVRSDSDVFATGFDRTPRYQALVSAAPHPAYVFDLSPMKDAPNLPDQVTARMAAGDPRFAGYRIDTFDTFVVFSYAGAEYRAQISPIPLRHTLPTTQLRNYG